MKCYFCGLEITGDKKPVMPGKVPGAYREVTIVEEVKKKGMTVKHEVLGEWKDDGVHKIPYAHIDCPK